MTNPCLYPLVLSKGDDLLEITRAPIGGVGFVGLHNGHPVVQGKEASLVLRALIGC